MISSIPPINTPTPQPHPSLNKSWTVFLIVAHILFISPFFLEEYVIGFALFLGVVALILISNNPVNGLIILPFFIFMPFELPGLEAIQFSEVGALLVILSFVFFTIASKHSMEFHIPAMIPIGLILLAACLSTINAEYFVASTKNILKFIEAFLLIYILTINFVRKKETIIHVLFSIMAAGLLAAMIGIFIFLSGDVKRVFGFLGGGFGAYIGISLIIAVNMVMNSRNKPYKLFAGLSIPILISALILSQTRAWLLGTILAIAFIIFSLKNFRKSFLFIVLFGITSVGVYLALSSDIRTVNNSEMISAGVERAFQTGLEQDANKARYISLLMRLFMWIHGFDIYMQNPIFGFGIGNLRFRNAFTGELGPPSDPNVGYVDNHWLNILYETGIIGIIGWLWLAFIVFSTCRHLIKNSKSAEWKLITLSLVGAIIVFFVGSIFWTLTVVHEMTVFLAFIIGLLFVVNNLLVRDNPAF